MTVRLMRELSLTTSLLGKKEVTAAEGFSKPDLRDADLASELS